VKKFLIALSLAFFLVSCDTEAVKEEVNPFIGTWEHPVNGARYIVTKTSFTCCLANGDIYYTGTYTYDDKIITINVDAQAFPLIGDTVVHPYEFIDGIWYAYNDPLIKIN
jgi:hypothetical protein